MKLAMHKGDSEKFSIKKRIKSFGYAFKGIRDFLFTTHNAWIHITVAILVVIAGFYFHISVIEWIGIVLSIGMVLSAEALNTAVVDWVDLVQPEYNKKAGSIKDIAAGAVLLTAICATIIGLLIFVPKVMDMLA